VAAVAGIEIKVAAQEAAPDTAGAKAEVRVLAGEDNELHKIGDYQ